MRDAVIVSTARAPIGRAYRGAFNATPSPTLAAHAIRAAARSGIGSTEIDDVIIGAALPQGFQQTIGRTAALRAGLPVTVPGMVPDVYIQMLETAEIVAKRYDIRRERQDTYTLRSQQRTAKAQVVSVFDREIVPVAATMSVTDKASGEISLKDVTLGKDEGNRPDTTIDGLSPRIDRIYGLADAGAAITRLSSRSAIGKDVERFTDTNKTGSQDEKESHHD
ncbi:thiolase family protein [Pseudochrobactrum kiredjianiae]|uniref:Thiolase N-terminal domain-containing protein n=1 Tax=Pseudochrobactrum kiredjianiae TaxID=386305 RepID=A0ABW3V5F3_9HYPH|nr:hypothetical protein [Pseudochrobactrum kiredjianiae]MDM7852994.1 hypothetical protein [Pseudochrobactrum kiredjianiae]